MQVRNMGGKFKYFYIFILRFLTALTTASSEFPTQLSLSESFHESRSNDYSSDDASVAKKFLKKFNTKADKLMREDAQASWLYETDLTEEHLQKTVNTSLKISEFFLVSSENATMIKTLDLPAAMHRQISLIRHTGSPTSYAMRREIKEAIGKMTGIFGKAKVCKRGKNYTIDDLHEIFKKSRDRKELNWAWKSWRDKVGPPMKNLYSNSIDLLNVGAREHGWIDYGNFLRSDYEMGDDFELSLDSVWNAIEPLYKELHAYVRYRLSKVYKINKTGCVPANLFGDMFAQNWESIFDLVRPKKTWKEFDVTKQLKEQKYTVSRIFHLAEKFFVSIGLDKMPDSFWKKSVLVKPKGKEMVCHASAWDVSNTDVRIKMCTRINEEHFTTVHHEMGHIEYFLAYKNQPNTFRAGANPGFHEAIGDTISLSVATPTYLNQIRLLNATNVSKDDTMSFLLSQALRRVAPIPYNLLVDKWRWRVYEGNVTENMYNREWWKMRVKYQGVEPPVKRPANAFDAASKYHVGANVPYIAYFFSYIFQFQLHKALCKKANHQGPLHTCSIYNSKEAGKSLRVMLEAGRSKPWPKILKEAIGDRELKADAILEYFEPLKKWLQDQRKTLKYPIGWKNHMTTRVLQKKTKKYEAGHERSGILKTNSGDVSLSISIPTSTLNELLKKTNETTPTNASSSKDSSNHLSNNSNKNSKNTEAPAFDLNSLLESAKVLGMKSSQASTSGNETEKVTNDEISISSGDVGANKIDEKENQTVAQNEKTTTLGILPLESILPGIVNSATSNKTTVNELGKTNEKGPSNDVNSASESPENQLKSLEVLSLPIAVNKLPQTDFPSSATSPQEAKQNPQTAAIAKNHSNPIAAAVPQEPKPNPVPSEQIALVPVSLPGNVISALKQALNSSNSGDSSLQGLGRNSSTGTLDTSQVNHTGAKNDSSALTSDKENNSSSSELHESTTHQTNPTEDDANSLSVSNMLRNTTMQLPDSSKLLTNVARCKRNDGSCMHSKVTTEGNTFPMLSNGLDDSKKTISISPSLLIQKILQHQNIKESSKTPPPEAVVNVLRNTSAVDGSSTTQPTESSNKGENNKLTDITQFVKQLTGINNTTTETQASNDTTSSPMLIANNTIQNATEKVNVDKTYENFLKSLADQSKRQDKLSNRTDLPTSCSDLAKRGVSLKFNCNEKGPVETKTKVKKGGTLSISPSDLLQKLLEGNKATRNEINKKTSSAAHVVKTPNGFQLDFDLNPKDRIPTELSNQKASAERQQHVDILDTPKGMVVKPKSSFQLLRPQFVPVQSKDHIELRNKDG